MKFKDTLTANAGGEKLQHLILFIAIKSISDDSFGKVKLNKLLFHADFGAFKAWGASITGEPYFALQMGPAPKYMLPTLLAMEENKLLAIQPQTFYGKPQEKPVALKEPNLGLFSSQEIALVDSIIEKWWAKNAKEMTDDSHEFIGWKLASLKEEIPYEVALVGKPSPSKTTMENVLKVKALIAGAKK
jgi:hypothetical protein